MVPLLASLVLAQTTPPRSPAFVPLYVRADRRVLAMLRVGDNPPAPVVFDTGSNGNLLDLAYAKRLGLPELRPSNSVDGSTGKPVPGFGTDLRGARLGGVPVEDVRCTVFDYPVQDEVGIFGLNSFPNRIVTLDFERSRLRVEDKTEATTPKGEGFPYGEGGLPGITLDLAGTRVQAELDTGNDAPILLPLSLAKGLPLVADPVAAGTSTSAAGTQTTYKARLKGAARVGSVALQDVDLYFIAGGIPNVGLPIIQRLRLAFDPTGGRTWVLGPTAKAQ